MRHFILAALCAWAASAQTLTPPAELANSERLLTPRSGEKTFRCSVHGVKPALDFGLHLKSGYTFQLPLSSSPVSGRTGAIVLRVTPAGGAPAYFSDHLQLLRPGTVPEPALAIGQRITGAFFTGEGRYTVEFAFSSDDGRVCRGKWQVDARLRGNEGSVKLLLPPGAVADREAAHSAAALRPNGVPSPQRITILMNAVTPGAAEAPFLEALLERFAGAEVRLVVFVTHGPPLPGTLLFAPEAMELVHREGLKPEDLDGIAAAIEAGRDHARNQDLLSQTDIWELLADLLHRERRAQPPPDLVLFLGVRNPAWFRIPPHFLEGEPSQSGRVFYLQYTGCTELLWLPPDNINGLAPSHRFPNRRCPANDLPGGDLPDSIEQTVRLLKGQTLPFYSPAGLAQAIKAIKQAAGR